MADKSRFVWKKGDIVWDKKPRVLKKTTKSGKSSKKK